MSTTIPRPGAQYSQADEQQFRSLLGRLFDTMTAKTVQTKNASVEFSLTSATNLQIRVRGNDGIVRTVDLTLS